MQVVLEFTLLCVGPPLQAAGRHVAHYHCVVCSATIARKTDMVSHLKRHINKGETEASYSGSSDLQAEEEPGEKRCPFLAVCPGTSELTFSLIVCPQPRLVSRLRS